MSRGDRQFDDGDGDVHFVVGETGTEPDEELFDTGGPDRNRRLRIEIGLGALALVFAFLVVRAVSGSHDTPQSARSAAPVSSLTPGPTPTGPVTAPAYLYRGILPPRTSNTPRTSSSPSRTMIIPHVAFPTDVPGRRGTDPRACPTSCSTTSALPAQVSDAIHAAFPGSTVEQTDTIRLADGVLWFREVDARIGDDEIVVRVQARSARDPSAAGYGTRDGQTTTFVRTTLGPWYVDVEVLDPLDGEADIARVGRLAHDPRITLLRAAR